jgi:phenylacetate-CoA ligase
MRKTVFKLGYLLRRPMVLKYYREFVRNNSKSVAELEREQNNALKQLIGFCFDHVPYYQELFKRLHLSKDDICTIKDLEKLPILTKAIIKSDPERLFPINVGIDFVIGSTGGSTGAPLKYRISPESYYRGVALLYRGLGFGGYMPGDRVAIIAGASLVSNKETFRKTVQNVILNFRQYSSYGVDPERFNRYLLHMNQWKPSYLRGYASSLYLLAKHIEENKVSLGGYLKGIFSTAEVLSIHQRSLIERVFHTKVFDTYGLNDGGISAYECRLHDGMHIDYERAIMQIVDDSGSVVIGVAGRIIATSLYDFAMPFIRYDTGDLGVIDVSTSCSCGSDRALLKQVYGRTTDYLKLNGKMIGSPVLTVLMGKVDLENYQIRQIDFNEIDVVYVNRSLLDSKDEDFIRRSFLAHVGLIKINFKKVHFSELLAENKHKFIVNEACF